MHSSEHMPLFVVLVAFLHAACDAACMDAQEKACVAERVRKQLVQTRKGMVVKTDEQKEVGADDVDDDEKSMCPWHMDEGKGCHQHSIQKAKCADGNYTWDCIKGGHGERQQCPCIMPFMCNLNTCGSERKEYCCETSCKDFGGIRDCDGKPEIEPTGEPVMPLPGPPGPPATPAPTPTPKLGPCGSILRYDKDATPPSGWTQCYIDQRDTDYYDVKCSELVKKSKVCKGRGAKHFGCWHGLSDPNNHGAHFATNEVVKYSCMENIQHSHTYKMNGNPERTTYGICIFCGKPEIEPTGEPVMPLPGPPGPPATPALTPKLGPCGSILRYDKDATPPPGWTQCYIDQRDTDYYDVKCSELVEKSKVCKGRGAKHFGCWHGLSDPNNHGAHFATNEVVKYSCMENIQHSHTYRMNGNPERTTYGICIFC